jgi:transmembrane sensor
MARLPFVEPHHPLERRVKLTGGEAHFTVWKDKARPFVVDVGGIEVRAVGTAFNVRLEPGRVEVLVTEGRVAVQENAGPPPAGAPAGDPGRSTSDSPTYLNASQRAVIDLAEAAPAVVTPVTADDINRDLSWQAPRLQFSETRLADAVAEFNRLNRQQIVIADRELHDRLIGGTVRPDNPEGFVRLLSETMEIRIENTSDGRTILRR